MQGKDNGRKDKVESARNGICRETRLRILGPFLAISTPFLANLAPPAIFKTA